jgi:hypothetical protein
MTTATSTPPRPTFESIMKGDVYVLGGEIEKIFNEIDAALKEAGCPEDVDRATFIRRLAAKAGKG